MKIITNTIATGTMCYVQVKDLCFLARISKNNNLMQQYINFINGGHTDNEFVRITNPIFVELISRCDYIINFSEYAAKNNTPSFLSNLLININYTVLNSELEKEAIQHKSDAIRDIIAFKRGVLDYKIPLVPNGSVEYNDESNKLLFVSTIVEECYILRTVDGTSVAENDYYKFYLDCIDRLFVEVYPDSIERNLKVYDKGNMLVITVNPVKKKENKISRVLNKIKRGN